MPTQTELNAELLAAAKADKRHFVRTALASGAEVDCTDEHGHTPLILAACHGHRKVVQTLLNAGANPHLTDDFDWTARQWADKGYYIKSASLLKEAEKNFTAAPTS